MVNKTALIGSIASLGLALTIASGTTKNKLSEIHGLVGCVSAIESNYTQKLFILTHPTFWIFFYLEVPSGQAPAQTSHEARSVQTNSFQPIDQPLGNKLAITLGGLGLIGLELWWFLLSKPKSQTAVATVDTVSPSG
jgi:plastocyanin domain-containing protein